MIRGRAAGLAGPALLTVAVLLLGPGLLAVPGATARSHPAAPTAHAVPGQHTPPGRSAVGSGALAVTIESLAPSIPAAGDTVEVRGTVSNPSADPVSDVAAVLRISPTPLPNRGEIPEVLAGAGQRTGVAVAGTRTELADELAPGGSVPFTLTAAVDDLPMASPGAYVLGAEALGSTGTVATRQDIDRTFLPWWPQGADLSPLLLTTLWPIVGPPVQDARGVLLNDDPAVQMSPAGRLSTIVESAAERPGAVTLLVDPQAVQVAADMADGYEVRRATGTTKGARSREVAAWLDSVRAAVADPRADAAAMLYGQPDVVAARRGRALTQALSQRATIDAGTERALGTPLPASVALVPGGMSDEPTAARLATARLGATVLSDRALPLAEPAWFTPSGSVALQTSEGPLPVLLTDSGLSAALMMPAATPAQATAARQRLLAETLTIVTELAETQRLLVAAPDPRWSPPADGARMLVTALATTPWITPTGLAQALAREPSTLSRQPLQYGPQEQGDELPRAQVAKVRSQFAGLRSYAEVVAPDELPLAGRTAPTRGLAGWFRTDREQGAELVSVVGAQVREATGSVRVVSSGSITVSGASGSIPITVENDGPLPVTVGLTMTSDPPQLFQAAPVEPFPIEPGRRVSVEVVAKVAAAGPVPVTVQLTSPKGREFGRPGQLLVGSSAYADAAGILVRVALAALVLAVTVHGVRRARRRRRAQPPGPPRTEGSDG